MLSSLFRVLFQAIFSNMIIPLGDKLLAAGYGKRGMAELGSMLMQKTALRIVLGLLGIWMILSPFDLIGNMIVLILSDRFSITPFLAAAIPYVIFAIWFGYVRSNLEKQIAGYKLVMQYEQEQHEQKAQQGRQSTGWTCPQCGRANNATDITCPSCGTYQ